MRNIYIIAILIVFLACSIVVNVLMYDNIVKARNIIKNDSSALETFQLKFLKDSIHVCPPNQKVKYIYEKQKNKVIIDSVIVANMDSTSISTELDKILAEKW